MKPNASLLTSVFSIAALCGAAAQPARADMVTAQSQLTEDHTFTITNNGSTTAGVDFTLSGNVSITTATTGTGAASGSSIGSLMEGATILFTAPSSGPYSQTFHFDISSGGATILTATGSVITTASAASPLPIEKATSVTS